jgi:hypothetical protein
MTPEEIANNTADNELISEIKRYKGQIATLQNQLIQAQNQLDTINQQIRDRLQVITALRFRIDHI